MNKLYKIEAEISVNKDGRRSLPVTTGYRPGFIFDSKSQTSGSIRLLHKEILNLGESDIIEISFISDVLLGNIKPGLSFKFYEGPIEIGEGKVLKVIGWVERDNA